MAGQKIELGMKCESGARGGYGGGDNCGKKSGGKVNYICISEDALVRFREQRREGRGKKRERIRNNKTIKGIVFGAYTCFASRVKAQHKDAHLLATKKLLQDVPHLRFSPKKSIKIKTWERFTGFDSSNVTSFPVFLFIHIYYKYLLLGSHTERLFSYILIYSSVFQSTTRAPHTCSAMFTFDFPLTYAYIPSFVTFKSMLRLLPNTVLFQSTVLIFLLLSSFADKTGANSIGRDWKSWPKKESLARQFVGYESNNITKVLHHLDATTHLWPFDPTVAGRAYMRKAELYRSMVINIASNHNNSRALEASVMALTINPFDSAAKDMLTLSLSSLYWGAPPCPPVDMVTSWRGNVCRKRSLAIPRYMHASSLSL